MRIGQTSILVFLSNLVGSALGFIATIYFARILGAEVLGYYAIILALVAWLKLAGRLGFSSAVVKRISEGTEPSKYFTAGVVIIATFGIILSVVVVVFSDLINVYVGVQASGFVVLLLLVGLFQAYIDAGLRGERLVHISGILSPVQITTRSVLQIALVLFGLQLAGLIYGYALSALLVGVIGVWFLSVRISWPDKDHFRSLFDFAKYSWLGGLRYRAFNDVDIVVLGALVSSSLVGVYSVVWSIATFLTLFGNAVSKTLFPELSRADAEQNDEHISSLVTDSLDFAGLFAIPGLFGGMILADRLLLIYGEEFTQGTEVLIFLILATLIYGYQSQLINVLRGIDRPDVAFRINALFIATNLTLNVALILWIGWVGAAIATALTALLGLSVSYVLLRQHIEFSIPFGEVSRQLAAALLMTGIVAGVRNIIETNNVLQHNALIVVILVVLGAGVYFAVLLAISSKFRSTVEANIPVQIPLLS